MSNTKIKSSQFHGVVGHGTNGYFLITNGDGSMSWISNVVNPVISSLSYPGSATAADPAGGETITITGTGFKTGAAVTVGGTAAPSVSYVSATSLTITTPAKAAGDYDVVVTNTDGGTATSVNGISFNGIPSWTTAAGTLGTFASDTTISTITLQASEPDAGTITFSITNGALPTGLSLTGADIDGTTTLETADTLYTFTVTATDDETQTTPRTFTITVTKQFINTENFTINTYTGNGSTQSIEGKIGTAASFNGSSSYIDLGSTVDDPLRTAGEFGVSLWFNANSYGTNPVIFKLLNDTYVYIFLNGSNQLECRAVDSSNTSRVVTTSVSLNTWYHVVWTGDSTNGVTLYLNGSSAGNTSWNGTFLTYTNSSYKFNYLGYNGSNTGWYTGKIDQVRIFDKALSSSEVTTLYGESNTSTTKSTTDIFNDGSGVALYEFEEGAKDTGGVNGYIGSAGVFDGSSSRINLSSNPINGLTSVSFSFWLKPEDISSYQYVLSFINSVDGWNGVGVRVSNTGKINIVRANNGTVTTSENSTTTLQLNVWQHIVVTVSQSSTVIYLDGSEDGTFSSTPFTTNNTGSFDIGMNEYSPGVTQAYTQGSIDQLRIFNKAISSSEVTTLYQETSASATKSTTDIFSDSSGIALYELEGNANDTGTNDFEHHFFVSDAGSSSSSVRLNSTDADFTYTRPSGYSEWGGAFDVNNQSHQFSGNSSYVTLSESNKKWDKSGSQYNAIWGENSHSSGKYYFELEYLGAELFFGIIKQSTATTLYDGNVVKENSISYGSWNTTSYKYSTTNSSQGTALSTNDVLGFAVDFDNKELKYYINNTLQDTTSLQETIYNGTATNVSYAYDGTPTNVSFVGTSFQPDLVWIKERNNAVDHLLFDTIRGAGVYQRTNLASNEPLPQLATLSSFDSNGFSVGTDGGVNGNNDTYVAWCWKAGGTAVSNTDGSITSTVSANTEAGFSIVKWTTTSAAAWNVGHGLSSAPEMIISKTSSFSNSWEVYHKDAGTGKYLILNSSAAVGTDAGAFSSVTNTTWTSYTTNTLATYIAYCFHSVDGYQKVGSYTASSGDDVVTTGFKPRFVMLKRTDSAGHWEMHDAVRFPSLYDENGASKRLRANDSSAEALFNNSPIFFTDTGFTLDSSVSGDSYGDYDANGGTYIYLAIK